MNTEHPDLFPETLLVKQDGERIYTTSVKVAEHFGKRHDHVLRDIRKIIYELDLLSQSHFRSPKMDSESMDSLPKNGEPNTEHKLKIGFMLDVSPTQNHVGDDVDSLPKNGERKAEHGPKIGFMLDVSRAQNCVGDTEKQLLKNEEQKAEHERKIALMFDYFKEDFRPVKIGQGAIRQEKFYHITHDGFALLAMGFTGKEALEWKVKFLTAFRDMERQLAAIKEREANALYAMRPRWKAIVAHPELNRGELIVLTGHKSPNSITACRRRMREVGLI